MDGSVDTAVDWITELAVTIVILESYSRWKLPELNHLYNNCNIWLVGWTKSTQLCTRKEFLSFTLSWQATDTSQWYVVQFSLSIFFWLADETASIFQYN